MPKFAANLSMLYGEHDFLDRFAAAAKDGFQGVEYLFPYAFEKGVLAAALQTHKLTQVLPNMPPRDWAAGQSGIACLPDRAGASQDRLCPSPLSPNAPPPPPPPLPPTHPHA